MTGPLSTLRQAAIGGRSKEDGFMFVVTGAEERVVEPSPRCAPAPLQHPG